jgi:hypothetical protein
MKKLLYGVFCVAIVASLGCAITDYPLVTDTRGDFSGVIRTGHKAYIVPSSAVATLWDDGSDELFSMVYQNNYGDQRIYTFNNFDPSGAVNFLDQTYCDWRYEGCEVVRSWNPAQTNVDNIFDYEFFPDCSGARSLSILLSVSSRIGECGDAGFKADEQDLASYFASLDTTQYRGSIAYVGSINAENTSITLTGSNGSNSIVPIVGDNPFLITSKLQTLFPVGPNFRHTLVWGLDQVAQNGKKSVATVNVGGVNASFEISFNVTGMQYNVNRF